MPGFKASEERLTVLLGANAAADFSRRQCSFPVPKILGPLKYMLNLLFLCSINRTTKPGWHLFTPWFTENFKSSVESYCSEKKIFEIVLLINNVPGHPRASMERCNGIKVVFMPSSATSILQPMDQGVISTFKPYYLRNTFCKVRAAIVIPLMVLGKVNWKLSGKDSPF